MRLKIDWASLIVRRKFTVFAFFYFVFEGNFPITSRRGAYTWRSELTEVFHVTGLEGLYLRGLFSEFTVCYAPYFIDYSQQTITHHY